MSIIWTIVVMNGIAARGWGIVRLPPLTVAVEALLIDIASQSCVLHLWTRLCWSVAMKLPSDISATKDTQTPATERSGYCQTTQRWPTSPSGASAPLQFNRAWKDVIRRFEQLKLPKERVWASFEDWNRWTAPDHSASTFLGREIRRYPRSKGFW